jgi:hypothetical protein
LGNEGVKPLQKCTTITKFSTIFKVSVQYKLVSIQKYNKNKDIRRNNFRIFTEQRFSALQIIIKTFFMLYTNKLLYRLVDVYPNVNLTFLRVEISIQGIKRFFI